MSVLASDPAVSPAAAWTVDRSRELYGIQDWGNGYFEINERGHVTVRPRQAPGPQVDLLELVKGLQARGLMTPLLLRFPDLLEHRMREIYGAFQEAIGENGYRGKYV